ncbi:Flavin-dependent thymidylate synthase [Metallosphaera sp. J1]|uniref:FAD-dependent thymidylate synthase n=1 Tax=Metallosphaera javensis (ex Hofmann et al. 2022) TaxID=99938 RepID=UPI001EDFDC5B|nr:FAD-dependent thymidylate synthase [Metallosphaera javensis (ex Hofmann et al. 2022)]MCG3108727.1 Flavin-dependent thymidylate synthase [Metallosphaera javensis (ex Hofmann et al. 2022)]
MISKVLPFKVKLVAYNPQGERVVAIAAKMSRSRHGWDHHVDMPQEEVETWIRDSIIHGYWSVLEHSVYTFSVEGISRVASHQLVRHRIASYTQMSHRFAKPKDEFYRPVVPPSFKDSSAFEKVYQEYLHALESGVPEEDARYVLPNGVNTNLVVTMNARELYNFFGLRLCSRAQWEIRAVAWLMLDEVKKVHPLLFKFAGPNCILHENFVRPEDDPITLDQEKELVSSRCIEGVPRSGIWKCIRNSRMILEKIK